MNEGNDMGRDDENAGRDRELGMGRRITRRDFLNGVAVTIGASLLPAGMLAQEQGADESDQDPLLAAGITPADPRYYPPALTGMRGSHPGSFEAAHLVRDGSWKAAAISTGESYDLIVVGGGISGLAAAYFYRQEAGKQARILILDNHDDFGGHAKRNEFRPGGRLLLGNGGTFAIESPFPYSRVALRLMGDLGINPPALEAKHALHHLYDGLEAAVFFDKETFGADRLVSGEPTRAWMETVPKSVPWQKFLAQCPL